MAWNPACLLNAQGLDVADGYALNNESAWSEYHRGLSWHLSMNIFGSDLEGMMEGLLLVYRWYKSVWTSENA